MPGGETKRIFFTLPPVREIDLVGAVDVFTSANRAVGGKPLYGIKVVNAEKARADRKIVGMCGLSLCCDADFRSFRGEIDTLLIPGGSGVEESYPDAAAVRWLRQLAVAAWAPFARARFCWPTPDYSMAAEPPPTGPSPPSWLSAIPRSTSTLSRSGFRTTISTPRLASPLASIFHSRCWKKITAPRWLWKLPGGW